MNIEYRQTTLYRKSICEEQYTDFDFTRSDINNCNQNLNIYKRCVFDRSSLMLLRVQKCKFYSCSFRDADIISGQMENCEFIDCDFTLANIEDSTFIKCIFENCNFTGGALKENLFSENTLQMIDLNGGTLSLNNFNSCNIKQSVFGNCTCDYNFFSNCQIDFCRLNIELLGTSYGLTAAMLHKVVFLSLGRELSGDANQIALRLKEYYKNEHLFVELFVLRIGFEQGNILDALMTFAESFRNNLESKIYLPKDELTFIFRVFQELYRIERLPFAGLHYFYSNLVDILRDTKDRNKYFENLLFFHNNICLLYREMQKDFLCFHIPDEVDAQQYITVSMRFRRKPNDNIPGLLEQLHLNFYGCPPSSPVKLLEERKGSFLAIIQMTVATLFALQISLMLLTGCCYQLIRLRAAGSILMKKKLPRKYYMSVPINDEPNKLPQQLASMVIKGLSKKFFFSTGSDILDADNLESISEVDLHQNESSR